MRSGTNDNLTGERDDRLEERRELLGADRQSKVLWVSFTAFSLGFGIWAMFSALGPFLIKWYGDTATQTLFLSAMPPFFAACISIPLGVWTDRYGGRKVFTITLIILFITLMMAPFADNYFVFLVCGMALGDQTARRSNFYTRFL